MRQAGYTAQVIDISFIKDLQHLMLVLRKFLSKDTLWIGLSNTFLTKFCGVRWRGMEVKDNADLLNIMDRFVEQVRSKHPQVRFVYGNSGLRQDITAAGFVKFEGFVDQEILDFTNSCSDHDFQPTNQYQREYRDFGSSTITWTADDLFNDERAVPIEISRGCIFRCDFCRFPLNGKKKFDYIKNLDVLYGEFMHNYEQFGIKDYIFTDDTFNDSMHKLREIEKVTNRLPFQINFVSYIRLDLMMRHPEMITVLRDLGLISATLGIETAVPENAKLIGKNIEFHKQMEFLKEIKQNEWKDVNTSSGFIVGLPYDDMDKVNWLFNFLFSKDNPLDNFIVATLQIYPTDRYNMTYSSIIDKDYASLGYRFVQQAGIDYESWVNDRTGLDEITLSRMTKASDVKKRSISKYTGFEVMDLQNVGVSKQDLLTMTMQQIDEKYDTDRLLQENYRRYLDRLMRLKG